MDDGAPKMAVTFAGRLFRVAGLSDEECRATAAALITDWRRSGRDHDLLAKEYKIARREDGPDAALLPLRHKWFKLLKEGAERRELGYSAVVDLTMYYFNKVASWNFK